jgi:hypothetical protein
VCKQKVSDALRVKGWKPWLMLKYMLISDWQCYTATTSGRPACESCSVCISALCSFHDGYGQPVERSNACYDESKKVVVKIIDS